MNTFYIYQPVAKGKSLPDKIDVFIGLFTPGKENAIKRDELTQRCVGAGLIGNDVKDKDRAMRNLLARAKVDYNVQITNDGDGEGYYIPTFKESVQLARNNKREDKKAISTLKGNKGNKALYDDYQHGRIGGGEVEE
jgi:hypothetical protein